MLDLHTLPLATVPQLPFTHGWPTQSPSPVQVVEQTAPLHLNGAQDTGVAGVHVPLPSQLAPVTALFEAVSQLPVAQSVPFSNL